MFKTKLFAGICVGASVITAAATALTLYLSGPSDVKTIHQYSPNEQVEMSLEGAFNSMSNTATELTQFVNVITSNKTSTNIGFTINHADGYEELSGVGGELELQLDTDAKAAAVILNATLGSVDVIDGTIYIDRNELIAAVPVLYDGIIKVGLDNLAYDLENSFIGSYILKNVDIEELEQAFELVLTNYETYAPQFDFDSDKFYAGLSDTLTKSYNKALDSMELEDLGSEKLNGGSYQCYNAKISVKELSNILKDAVVYCMESPEFQSLVDQSIEYYVEITGESIPELEMFSGSTLGQFAGLLDANWSQIISRVEDAIGQDISFNIYISDTVELAGIEINMYENNGKITFNKEEASNTKESITISCDFTGGKNIGDYTELVLSLNIENDPSKISFISKTEENGDFDITFSLIAPEETYVISAEGNYVEDGDFFNLDIDSIKMIEDDKTLYDFGFSCGFKPIDAITKPSASPVYDIWEMDEYDFAGLIYNIQAKLESLSDIIK